MHFSDRTNWELGQNEFAAAVEAAKNSGCELLDLSVSNPTVCGFDHNTAYLLAPLSEVAAMQYAAEPLGTLAARVAVRRYYIEAGADVATDRLCLTTSTSEAYSFLFRLLCDPGDEVVIARPSYPLFDFIARLDDVKLCEYPLLYDPHGAGWVIDLHALESAISAKTRAIVVVHPNNPTGNFASVSERAALTQICAERGIALIVDEVFLDYPLAGAEHRSFAAGEMSALCFVLSGISKVCGLPQMKASWIATCGPEKLVRTAMERLEVIADTFLSMNAPVQQALPHWLACRHGIQNQIRERMGMNLDFLRERLHGSSTQMHAMQGGWTVVLRVPREINGKKFPFAALERGVIVQPGEFYGLSEGRVVLSLLSPPQIWREGLAKLPVD
jgi:aspartate/methionine/tyrosine aminotransferase